MSADISNNDIAIIGMSGAFPGVDSVDQLWANLLAGKDLGLGLTRADAADPDSPSNFVPRTYSLKNSTHFDAEFFGYSPQEALLLDPQHRLFLQHCWLALESSGYPGGDVDGYVGVYAGCGMNRYAWSNLSIDTQQFGVNDFQKMLAIEKDFLSTRVSYKLNLKGPSINVQSACSTSLVAVQQGVASLQSYQCDLALCGGVSLNFPRSSGYFHYEGLIFSPSGRCRPFSPNSDGTVFGEGVGVVVLKRLSDAIADSDSILAVINGAAVNNDGADKVGFTAPSVQGQADVIEYAHQLAGIQASQVKFIETHGTGTRLGDPIELSALKQAFEGVKPSSCALGTLKANIGHLDAAAGVAALIKTVLVVSKRLIPPNCSNSVHETPQIGEDHSAFYFNDSVVDLSGEGSFHAGVSSFGVGGTNAHVVLSSPPNNVPSERFEGDGYLLVYSAKTEQSTLSQRSEVEKFLQSSSASLSDIAFTLKEKRKNFDWRCYSFLQAKEPKSAILSPNTCRKVKGRPRILFMFSGQGVQYRGMAKYFYDHIHQFRDFFDECIDILQGISDQDFRHLLLVPIEESSDPGLGADIHRTDNAQVCLFVLEYCLARLLMSIGVSPNCLVGHSLGEYTAACIAGIFNLEQALKIVVARGSVMHVAPEGAMLLIAAGKDDILKILPDALTISVINSYKSVVVSGAVANIETFEAKLTSLEIPHKRLRTRHAFHSPAMDSVIDDFREAIKHLPFSEPKIKIISCSDEQLRDLADPEYWIKHLRNPVNFCQAVTRAVTEEAINSVIEIGPGSGLCSFLQQTLPKAELLKVSLVPGLDREDNSFETIAGALGDLWSSGVDLEFPVGLLGVGCRQVSLLPGYQFEQVEYCLSRSEAEEGGKNLRSEAEEGSKNQSYYEGEKVSSTLDDFSARNDLDLSLLSVWRKTLKRQDITIDDNFFEIGGDSLSALQLIPDMCRATGLDFVLQGLFEHPTIRALVDSVGEDADSASSVVHLNAASTGVPIFCLCGVQIYKAFADHFINNPVFGVYAETEVYAIQGGQTSIPGSMDAIVSLYVDAVKRCVTGRSLKLVGLSFGGLVAMDVARALKSQGFSVEHVVLLDSYISSSHVRTLKKIMNDLLDRINRHGFLLSIAKAMKKIGSKLRIFKSAENDVAETSENEERNRGAAFNRLANIFDPEGKEYDFDVLLIKAAKTDVGFGMLGKHDYGFGSVISGELIVREVYTDHVGVLKEPEVDEVYEIVRKYFSGPI